MFREFLHYNCGITDDILIDRIYKIFNCFSTDDIDKQDWIIGFNIFLKGFQILRKYLFFKLILGTVEEQTKYCFDIYDLNEDGFISKEEIMTMMKSCTVKSGRTEEDGEEGVKVSKELQLYLYTPLFFLSF